MVASFQKVNPLVRKAGSFLVLTFICCCHTKVTEGRVGTDVVVEPWIMIVLTPPHHSARNNLSVFVPNFRFGKRNDLGG